MATAIVKEWTGLQEFPAATQATIHGLLGKLHKQNVNTVTVLVLGKGGVGKSSTVNSLLGERVAAVSAFQSETLRPFQCSRIKDEFTLNVIDTPGLVEGGCVNDQALDNIQRYLLGKTIDAVLYVDRLDGYRVDNVDKQVIRAISRGFGHQIWHLANIVLTHAQISPPEGVDYAEFVSKRSAALQQAIRKEAGFKRTDRDVPTILVENSGRCHKNSGDEKILPDGRVWLPLLVEELVDVVTGPSQSITVDQKLIDGPNANRRGKIWIPVVLLVQFLFILRPIRKAIDRDLSEEMQHRPQWELRAEEFQRTASVLDDDNSDERAITEALRQEDLNLSDQLNDFDDEDDDEDF